MRDYLPKGSERVWERYGEAFWPSEEILFNGSSFSRYYRRKVTPTQHAIMAIWFYMFKTQPGLKLQ
jgi:hypothetical protein